MGSRESAQRSSPTGCAGVPPYDDLQHPELGERRQVEAVVGGHRARAGVVVHRAAVGGVVQHAPAARRKDHAAGEDPRGDGRLHDLTHLEEDISEGYARIAVLASTRGNTSW